MRFPCRVDDDLELRLLERRDAPGLRQLVLANRSRMVPWFWWVPLYDDGPAEAAAFIDRSMSGYADGTSITTAIIARDEWVGMVGVADINPRDSEGQLWYWLAGSAERQGFATRSAQTILSHVFADKDLHRVFLRCDPRNSRSQALAERLGFVLEGTLRECVMLEGKRRDLRIYGLLGTEWQARVRA